MHGRPGRSHTCTDPSACFTGITSIVPALKAPQPQESWMHIWMHWQLGGSVHRCRRPGRSGLVRVQCCDHLSDAQQYVPAFIGSKVDRCSHGWASAHAWASRTPGNNACSMLAPHQHFPQTELIGTRHWSVQYMCASVLDAHGCAFNARFIPAMYNTTCRLLL